MTKKNNEKKEKINVYDMVTNRIIEQLQEGYIPWQKPWSGLLDGAFNRVSKKPYSLLNQFMLPQDGEYASFKQWTELGGKVKKGEKAHQVVFWKILETKEILDGEEVVRTIPLLKYLNVFHISQVEGVEPLPKKINENIKGIDAVDAIVKDYAFREHLKVIEKVSNEAYYSPLADSVTVPKKEQFLAIEGFYGTLFHELTHSTGHRTRLNRFDLCTFGDESYSKEELVADIGSAVILHELGLETEKTIKNTSAYCQSWLRVLKNDNKFIVSAASKAEKAVKLILNQ